MTPGLIDNCGFVVHLFSFITEIESKYDKKMKALREELELRRKTEIHEIEEVFYIHIFKCYTYLI